MILKCNDSICFKMLRYEMSELIRKTIDIFLCLHLFIKIIDKILILYFLFEYATCLNNRQSLPIPKTFIFI